LILGENWKMKYAVFYFLLSLYILSGSADEINSKALKVFILAGQSNMVGKQSKIKELPLHLQNEQAAAFFFSGGKWLKLCAGKTEKKGFGPEISFAERTAQSLKEPIGIIKVSVGGTSLARDWSPQRKNSLYCKLLEKVNEARKSRPLSIIGMLWMQGGRDARNFRMAKAYKENLVNFINKARSDFKSPQMIFICGRSAAPLNKYPSITLVRKAQENIDLPGYSWLDCDSIPKGKDGVHYSTAGQVKSGYLFADEAIKLIKAVSGGKNQSN